MELVISIFLGAWVAFGAILCLIHYKNDEKRSKELNEKNENDERGEQQ